MLEQPPRMSPLIYLLGSHFALLDTIRMVTPAPEVSWQLVRHGAGQN